MQAVQVPIRETASVNFAINEAEDEEHDFLRARRCPIINSTCEGIEARALIDTGSEVSAISEEFHLKLKKNLINLPELPISKCFVVGVGKKRSSPITRQVLLTLSLNLDHFDATCLIVKNLGYDVVLGVDFLKEYGGKIDFQTGTVILNPGKVIIFEENEAGVHEPKEATMFSITREEAHGLINEKMQENCDLKPEELYRLQELLQNYKDVFVRPNDPIPDFQFRIQVTSPESFKCRSYPVPQALKADVDQVISDMIRDGIIERKPTAYINPLVIVRKKDGGVRICLDARKLNEITVPDYDAPIAIEETLWKFRNTSLFSAIDFTA